MRKGPARGERDEPEGGKGNRTRSEENPHLLSSAPAPNAQSGGRLCLFAVRACTVDFPSTSFYPVSLKADVSELVLNVGTGDTSFASKVIEAVHVKVGIRLTSQVSAKR